MDTCSRCGRSEAFYNAARAASQSHSSGYDKLETIAQKGPIDIQECRSQQGQQTQQSTVVTLFVKEETYWPMPTATGSVRCVFLVFVTTTD